MLKFIFSLIILLSLSLNAMANGEQRKTYTGRETTSAIVLAAPGTVYDVEILATSSNGIVAMMDSATALTPDGTTSNNAKMVVELGEATSGNSKHSNLGTDGVKFTKGIYLYVSNATAIVYYN